MDLKEALDGGAQRAALYQSREELFGWDCSEWPLLGETAEALEPYLSLWTTALGFHRAYPTYMEGPLLELDAEKVEREMGDWERTLYKLAKVFVGIPGPMRVIEHVRGRLGEFKAHLPFLAVMTHGGMRDRHWRALAEKAGTPLQPTQFTTLGALLAEGVDAHLPLLQEQADVASKEMSLEKALDKMLSEWKPLEFDVMEYRDTGTHILRALDDVQTLFDDHIVKTQSMRGSPFVKPFETRMREWETKLMSMQEILDEWLKCQSVWLYLEPIFSSEDIMRQMPQEAKRFMQARPADPCRRMPAPYGPCRRVPEPPAHRPHPPARVGGPDVAQDHGGHSGATQRAACDSEGGHARVLR